MDHLRTIITEFYLDLKAQKLRAFLTMFGIIWGTVAIVVLIAFGVGFKQQMSINMHGIGESIAIMFPGRTTKAWEGFGTGRSISFLEDDVRLLAQQIPELESVSPEYSTRVSARVGENILNPLVAGVIPIYGDMRNIIPEPGGRFINQPDVDLRRRVAVIGNRVRDFLFGQTNPIGRVIYVGEVPFTVIGVMQKKTQNSSYNSRDQDRVFIPSATYASVFGAVRLNNIIYKVKDPTIAEEVNNKVRAVLGKRYKFDPTDEDAVWIWDTSRFDKFIFYFFLGFNIFMGLIGSFTLGVAGLGVANIMYIVVQERIKEIGIKRAVGAKRSNILFQFFMETFFIVGMGSLIGFLIAVGLIELLQFIPIREFVGAPVLSMDVVFVTVAILTIIGLIAGLMPARKASNLDVVECLRT
ncbi:MAG: ABC transporter substrate-binding protein [Bacteroidia bacterium]|nr:MAG: ABC transporter substrate-binding protein [Bacteroidia bacterium]